MNTFDNLLESINATKKLDMIHCKYLEKEILKYFENKDYKGLNLFVAEELIKFIKISKWKGGCFTKIQGDNVRQWFSLYYCILYTQLIEELELDSVRMLDRIIWIMNANNKHLIKDLEKYIELRKIKKDHLD